VAWWGDSGFDRLAIIGLGQIGASVGLAARRVTCAERVIGYDVDPAAAAAALAMGAVTELADDLAGAVAGADLVVLAAPVSQTIRLVPDVVKLLPPRAVLTDVGSTKGPVVKAMEEACGSSGRFAGGHPMAGTEAQGPSAARADMFDGCRWVLCPGLHTRGDVVHSLRCFVSALGGRPVVMDAWAHDRQVAWTSHLPYITAAALCLALAEGTNGNRPSLCGGSLRDGTRVAASNPAMAGDYCMANRGPLSDGLAMMIAKLEGLRDALAAADEPRLLESLALARDFRASVSDILPPAPTAEAQ
jgi:prephenate dehydrogenase